MLESAVHAAAILHAHLLNVSQVTMDCFRSMHERARYAQALHHGNELLRNNSALANGAYDKFPSIQFRVYDSVNRSQHALPSVGLRLIQSRNVRYRSRVDGKYIDCAGERRCTLWIFCRCWRRYGHASLPFPAGCVLCVQRDRVWRREGSDGHFWEGRFHVVYS